MRLTSGELTIVIAFTAALAPTLLAIRSLLELKHVRHELHVPPKDNGVMVTDPADELPLGEVVHEIRTDLYELGRLLGSHLMFHEPNVKVQDLYPQQNKWNKDDWHKS